MTRVVLFLKEIPFILGGLSTTVELSVIALGTGFALGLPLALCGVYGNKVAKRIADAYCAFFRSIPLLVHIFMFYFVVAKVINLTNFAAAALAMGLRSAAYQSEIFRGGIQSVGSGQMAAAQSLGMSRFESIRYVVLPQAWRYAIPGWSNEAAVVLKDTSFAYAIGVAELMRRAEYVSARTYEPLTVFMGCAVIYFLMTFLVTRTLAGVGRLYRVRS